MKLINLNVVFYTLTIALLILLTTLYFIIIHILNLQLEIIDNNQKYADWKLSRAIENQLYDCIKLCYERAIKFPLIIDYEDCKLWCEEVYI